MIYSDRIDLVKADDRVDGPGVIHALILRGVFQLTIFMLSAPSAEFGLTICSTIVRAHGGEITLSNDDAGGAIAGFSLPAQEFMVAAQ